MNKKDCEEIGYILNKFMIPHDICEAIYELDERIKNEHIGFLEVSSISEEIKELTEKLMNQYNEHLYQHQWDHWSLIKRDKLVKTYKECLDEARKEIYGEG